MRLPIVLEPDPRLHVVCTEAEITGETRALAANMRDTIRAAGLGLAAPQVGHTIRLVVVNVTKLRFPFFALFNPLITKHSLDHVADVEGCLSDPPTIKAQLRITRPRTIDVQFTTGSGVLTKIDGVSGLLARVLQHEIDHLDGISIRDRLKAAAG